MLNGRTLTSLLLCLALMLALPPAPARAADARAALFEEETDEPARSYREGEVIAVFRPGYTAEELTAALNASGCTLPQRVTDEDVAFGFVTLLLADGWEVPDAAVRLSLLPEIDYAQPNYVFRLPDDYVSEAPADDGAARLLAAEIDDPERGRQWMLDAVNAYEAWDIVRTNGAVTVAVLDNGFSLDHEDLVNNYLRDGNGGIVQYDALHRDGEIAPGSHGTHCAGIIAAEANNGVGVAGVSYNARILPVQVLDALSGIGDFASIARGYSYVTQYAKDHPEANVRVISMSLGVSGKQSERGEIFLDEADHLLVDSIEKAYREGILTVLAAGNDADSFDYNGYLCYPCDFADNALGVIALERDEGGGEPGRVNWSNHNMAGQYTKDIAAPGVDVYSTYWDLGSGSGAQHNGYQSLSGTSMATPCVSGVAALMFAANPDLTAAEAAEIICSTAVRVHESEGIYDESGFSREYGCGMIDAAAAVRAAARYLRGAAALSVGSSAALTPMVDRAPQEPGAWEWTTSDPSVAAVENGVVTGVSAGQAVISASAGGMTLTRRVTVCQAAFSGGDTLTYGGALDLRFDAAPVRDAWLLNVSNVWNAYQTGADVTLVFPEVSGGGGTTHRLTGFGVGTAELTASLATEPAVRVSRTVRVEPADIALAEASVENQAWTGAPVEAKPTLVFRGTMPEDDANQLDFGEEVLAEGKDYVLSYENNTEIGEAVAVVTGRGNFTGEKRVPFAILGDAIVEGDVRFEGLDGSFVYTGEAQEPAVVTVTHNGAVLTEGADYRVVYTDNVNAGVATVTVRGVGAYAGAVSRSFAIAPADITDAEITGVYNQPYVPGGAAKPPISVAIGEKKLSEAELDENGRPGSGDYTAAYANNLLPGEASVTVSGVNNYTGTVTLRFNVCEKVLLETDVAVVEPEGGFVYNGEEHRPSVVVRYLGGEPLTEDEDYEIYGYAGNVNAGTAVVGIVPLGGYAEGKGGLVIVTFTIRKADIAPAVSLAGWYAGETPNVPVVTGNPGGGEVSFDYKVLGAADETYTAAVPTEIGYYTVRAVVAATDNYNGGSATANFRIGDPASAQPDDDYGGYVEPAFEQDLPGEAAFDGGVVAVSPAHAVEGRLVTLTALPERGFRLDSLTVTRADGGAVKLSGSGNTRTFFMPGGRIEIHAVFVPDTAVRPVSPFAPPEVVLSPQSLRVNGETMRVEAYNIGGTNFFKLRDLAALLRGTPAQFGVDYDAKRNAAVLTRGAPYAGEAAAQFTDLSASAVVSPQTVELDGQPLSLTAYNVGGANFFGLRELSAYFGYAVDYDAQTNTAIIESR